jgi:hypothetical protein
VILTEGGRRASRSNGGQNAVVDDAATIMQRSSRHAITTFFVRSDRQARQINCDLVSNATTIIYLSLHW